MPSPVSGAVNTWRPSKPRCSLNTGAKPRATPITSLPMPGGNRRFVTLAYIIRSFSVLSDVEPLFRLYQNKMVCGEDELALSGRKPLTRVGVPGGQEEAYEAFPVHRVQQR